MSLEPAHHHLDKGPFFFLPNLNSHEGSVN